MIARGYTFTHDRFLDIDWKPGPGQRYVDAPHAEMVVTRTTATTVWYSYADGACRYRMDRAEFERRFGR